MHMNVVIAAMSAPTHMNGVSRHAANLARALLRTRTISEIHFLAGAWQSDMYRSALGARDPRLFTHWIPLRDANVSRLLWYYRELPCIAAQLEAHIVHLTFPAPTGPVAYSCPVVLSLHDLYPFDIPCNFGRLKSAIARHTISQCVRRVDAIACVSRATQSEFRTRFPDLASKSHVIQNVVEFGVPAAISGNLEMLKGFTFILCVAQHRSNKNIPLAIRVFNELMGEGILSAEARMVVVGIPGPETGKIEEEIKRCRLGRKVLLLSGLSDAELRWCYEKCQFLLAPSSMEGFGIPIAEALLAGARVVCSDIQAFRELGGEACHYVPWTSDLVNAYVRVIRDAMSSAPLCGVFPFQLTSACIGEQYANLYRDLIYSPLKGFGAPPRSTPAVPMVRQNLLESKQLSENCHL